MRYVANGKAPALASGSYDEVILHLRAETGKDTMQFYVYFDQVNQTKFRIEALTKLEAIAKAKLEWRHLYGFPVGTHIEELPDSKT